MKPTSLEKLIKVDQVIQVQQQYSQKIGKRSDDLDQRIRNYQKQLTDKKAELEIEINQIPDVYNQITPFKGYNRIVLPAYDPETGMKIPKRQAYKNQLIAEVRFLDEQVSDYDEELARHAQLKVKLKKVLKMIDQMHQKEEWKSLFTDSRDGLADASIGKTRLYLLLTGMNQLKKYLHSFNRMWDATLTRDQSYLDFSEFLDRKRDIGTVSMIDEM